MATFGRSDDLRGARFVQADLRGARFVGADLSGVVMRGVELREVEIDTPWLFDGDNILRVNGVDVLPLVEAEPHTILDEEWEHHRYAVRDLDTIAAAGAIMSA